MQNLTHAQTAYRNKECANNRIDTFSVFGVSYVVKVLSATTELSTTVAPP